MPLAIRWQCWFGPQALFSMQAYINYSSAYFVIWATPQKWYWLLKGVELFVDGRWVIVFCWYVCDAVKHQTYRWFVCFSFCGWSRFLFNMGRPKGPVGHATWTVWHRSVSHWMTVSTFEQNYHWLRSMWVALSVCQAFLLSTWCLQLTLTSCERSEESDA